MKKLFISIYFLVSCATAPLVSNTKCPAPPKMEQVQVINGIISGINLDHAIKNNTLLWQYIQVLRRIECPQK